MRGVFLDKSSIEPQGVNFSILDKSLSKWNYFDNTSTQSQISARIEQAELVVTNKVPLSLASLNNAKQLKCICVAATGADHIDIEAAKSLGIFVCNIKDYSTQGVAQHTFGMMIALMSQIINYHKLVFEGAWACSEKFCLSDFQTHELYDKTLGIIGYGQIGQSVANIANAFGMKVLVSDRKGVSGTDLRPNRTTFEEVLRHSDIVSLHCPLSTETRDLISEQEFKQMKRSAILINIARGGVVDELALYSALKSKIIRGAALDVLAKEPPTCDNPLLSYSGNNLIITPHVAWNTVESRQRLVNELALNIQAFQQGQKRNALT